jgi:predicted dehydrogenase
MGSKRTCREGLCIGTDAIVHFDILAGVICRQMTDSLDFDSRTFGGTANRDALERAYFEEINGFVDCIQGKATWPLDYSSGATATATLAACEASAKSKRVELVDAAIQPGLLPA